jgi:hypothetical protein
MLESRACREFQKDYSVKHSEHIQQEGVIFIMPAKKENDAQDAEVVDGDQKSLPEGEEK